MLVLMPIESGASAQITEACSVPLQNTVFPDRQDKNASTICKKSLQCWGALLPCQLPVVLEVSMVGALPHRCMGLRAEEVLVCFQGVRVLQA